MEHSLRHPYPSVAIPGGPASCGGNQGQLSTRALRQCGCGAVAMADLLCYLSRYHGYRGPSAARLDPIPPAEYDLLVRSLLVPYLPIVPPLGTSGISLAAGLNLYFMTHHTPLTAAWGVPQKDFWGAMGALLARDLPVIFSIGPNLPLARRHPLTLYRRAGDLYVPASRVTGHFITAIGLDDNWVRISSWGREFFIHRREYSEYAKLHSLSLSSNLLWLTKPQRFTLYLG